MSRQAIKAINWSAVAEKIVPEERTIFANFKAKSDTYLRQMQSYPESSPKIDWSFYSKTITAPGFVDKFKKEYESLSIPYPADKYSSLIDSQEKETKTAVEQFKKEADEVIASLRQEIEKINALLPYTEMTMEDFALAHPDIAWNPDKPTFWPHDRTVEDHMIATGQMKPLDEK
ncbi:ATP synthase subunit d, mitochondrial-like [Prorops nasuta]|uniref:ATP synthase subunit d, mitochondrial-like n=1 Tax=Prorops nasuta TaxID=863751 RepID=UPI0034CF4C7C